LEHKWSLKELYSSFSSEEFKNDLIKCDEFIDKIKKMSEKLTNDKSNLVKILEEYINISNYFSHLSFKLMAFCQLTLSVDTKNADALRYLELLEEKLTALAQPSTKFTKWIGSLQNLDEIIKASETLKEHAFYLREEVKKNKYILGENEEIIISKMRNTGSSAWSKLQDLTTSNLLVDIDIKGKKEKLPLTIIRNMAYDDDKNLRKLAYEAELKSYKKIEDVSAACLNGIKGEVITVAKLRGYKSPLEESLINSRMDRESLDAMFNAIKEYLPVFKKYFRKKAEILGYKNGLPFYELFAPIGKNSKQYTYEDAKEFIVYKFKTFSDKLSNYALNAFDKNWIDAEPREGKVGGAFCENLHVIGESRIMSNFSGNFGDVVTLAHELGHGYHGSCLLNESAINSEYPMPIAETASTFCETIIKKAAVKNVAKEEALLILETEISDCAQVIVDIYSRFLFEQELFERREKSSLSSKELQEIMIESQKKSYGEGLDLNYLHPYMWVCKPHYYSAGFNFYNYPYAFGLLFSKGLYSKYLEDKEKFVAEYDTLLSVTGKNQISDITKLMNIDIHSMDFWRSSLELIREDIDKFIKLLSMNLT
jgi:pepF/M3 family oligoendopeptidase